MNTLSEPSKTHGWTLWNYVMLFIGISWLFGILFVEYFYYYTKRLRYLDPKIKEKMLPFTNAPEKWNKIVFYICIFILEMLN